MQDLLDGPLLLAGAGKMGGAMLTGWLAGGLPADKVVVQDPGPPPEIAALLSEHGIARHESVADVLDREPAVMLMAVAV